MRGSAALVKDGRSSQASGLEPDARRLGATLALGAWTLAALVLVFWRAFWIPEPSGSWTSSIERDVYDALGSSPGLALSVFAAILYLRRDRLRSALGARPAWGAGAVLLALGVLLTLWAASIRAIDLSRLSLALLLAGGALWLGGARLLRAIAPALLALLMSVPPPLPLLHQVVFPLQLITAKLASGLLSSIGQSHLLLGDQILRGGIRFHVIEGCSGLRSIWSLGLAGLLLVELVGRSTREKVALLAVVPLVACLVNGFRVVVLVLREVPDGSAEHAIHGLIMIAVGVVLLSLIEAYLWPLVFRRGASGGGAAELAVGDPQDIKGLTEGDAGGVVRISAAARLGLLAGIATVLALLLQAFPRPLPVHVHPARVKAESIVRRIPGWTVSSRTPDRNFLGSLKYTQLVDLDLERGDERARVFLGVEDRTRRERFGWSPKTAIPGPGWLGIEELPAVKIGDRRVERLLVRYPGETRLVYHWRRGYAPWGVEFFRNGLGLDFMDSVPEGPSVSIRIEARVEGSDDGMQVARARLEEIALHVEHGLSSIGSKSRNKQ